MDFLEVLEKRVSSRAFLEAPLSDEEIEFLLSCAYKAPIAEGKYEDCQLTVLSNKEILEAFVREYQEKTSSDRDPLYGAGTFIIFSSRKDSTTRFEDCGVVLENIALGATSLGLGSCYIRGAVNILGKDADYIASLGLDEEFYPVSGIVVGSISEELLGKDHTIKTNIIA